MNENAFDSDKEGLEPQVVVLKVSNMFMINYNYLIIDHINSESILLDPAWEMDKIELALEASRTTLKGILLTHSHFDHLHLARPLAEKYDCPIWMSREEITISKYSAPQLQGIGTKPFWVGSLKIKPLFTPGHTLGSMCYLIGNNLFSGDTLFYEGCGLCPDIESAYDMFDSLKQITNTVKPTTRIFPGHKYVKDPGQVFSSVYQNNIYLQFNNKHDFASYRLRKGQNHSKFFEFQ
ncbi:putative polyketide biosynthesis zinc-dependent hydrolase BaeB [Kordia antarctica]|uniref:Putative polyketide biosynthesis zinc-dependent hydrolase BaeB n=1 Tax=Kordia antarctica TaxID=1218801 RepID=A0A7L4ZHT4_9FLAO|nr:MBL fold metallo-hydrolase [Kordia antarctica]QHI36090.1 putative polyketide biosynthesis zinc-dependent hydrolase BaeB [Kordia antarctica]